MNLATGIEGFQLRNFIILHSTCGITLDLHGCTGLSCALLVCMLSYKFGSHRICGIVLAAYGFMFGLSVTSSWIPELLYEKSAPGLLGL
ncbi:hypothetical protein RND71_042239 [Anisodus tanguticus]|uniref:Uncharacterized protein n=1 Tax=Anisodus tanguticus TaxID=243964 RepID=A0AAE1QT47_9SOLA|nr:hypothetical protein RND71_042239 [Anisodus tanguticus]